MYKTFVHSRQRNSQCLNILISRNQIKSYLSPNTNTHTHVKKGEKKTHTTPEEKKWKDEKLLIRVWFHQDNKKRKQQEQMKLLFQARQR